MSRQHHELKTETEYYQAVEAGDKNFEVRINDRDFKVWDRVVLAEVVRGIPTGRKIGPFDITYVLAGGQFGILQEYCVLGLKMN